MSLERRYGRLSFEEREVKWQELALTREEIPIFTKDQWPGRHPDFIVPIHPLVENLPEEIRFDRRYAEEVFDLVWDWTKEDVNRFINDPEKKVSFEEKECLERMIKEGKEHWRFEHFSPSQNLLLSAQCRGFDTIVFANRADNTTYLPGGIMAPHLVRFSREKIQEYSVGEVFEGEKSASFRSSAFLTHNVDNMIQAFLLRNWCIAYHNNLLRTAFGLVVPR